MPFLPPSPRPARSRRWAVALACTALALTACSSDDDVDPVPRASSTSSPTPSATATASGPAAPVSPRPLATTPAVPSDAPEDPLEPRPPLESPPPLGAPQCRAADLSLVDADAVVTATSSQAVYVVRTTGPDCQLEGWPAVELLREDGSRLPVEVRRGGNGLPPEQAQPVTLSRSTSVSFRLATPRADGCTPVATVRATLPGTDRPLTASTYFSVCQGSVGTSPVERSADDHSDAQ